MAYQSLGIGSSLNDGTGDTLRSGGSKINDNFSDNSSEFISFEIFKEN